MSSVTLVLLSLIRACSHLTRMLWPVFLLSVVVCTAALLPSAPAHAASCGTGYEEIAGMCFPTTTGLPDADGSDEPLVTLILNILQWLLGMVGIIAVASFLVIGIRFFMLVVSGSADRSRAEAKTAALNAILGVVVALSGVIVLRFVENFLAAGAF